MSLALVCSRCAASLPSPGGDSPFVTCSFCGTTHAVSAAPISMAQTPAGPSDADRVRAACDTAWDAARASSKDPIVALRAVIAARSGALTGQLEAERAARLGEALMTGFDSANGTKSVFDKMASLRIAEAVVKAVIELRKMDSTDINLPFFMATEKGPLHISHEQTAAKLAELDAVGAYVVKEVAAPAAAPAAVAPPEKAKRSWWPF